MKIYVMCDLEGTAGVVDHRLQCWFDGAHYAQARRLATLELNALVEGALAGGATEIVAWDGHGPFPGGLDVELLHPACQLVMGAGDGGPAGLDASFDAMLLLGLHGMAGVTKAVLSHSFMGHIAGCWVNGLKVGEIGINCLTAGLQGVPTIFISGDGAAIEEARALIPQIEGVAVKQGLAETAVPLLQQAPMISLAPQKAREMIKAGAQRALAKVKTVQPFFINPPYTARTQFYEAKHADALASGNAHITRIDDTTIEACGEEFLLI